MIQTAHGNGWVESGAKLDDDDRSLNQAFADIGVVEDSNLRLIYGLLKVLRKKDNSLFTDSELRLLIPTVISAFSATMPDESMSEHQGKLSFYKTLLQEELANVLADIPESDRELLREKAFVILSGIKLQSFSRLLLNIFESQLGEPQLGEPQPDELKLEATRSAATEQVLNDFFAQAIADLPSRQASALRNAEQRSGSEQEKESERKRISKILTSAVRRIDPKKFISQIADNLHADLQDSMTVASFSLLSSEPNRFKDLQEKYSSRDANSRSASFKYTSSPFPAHVLTAVRNAFFVHIEIPELQAFYQTLEKVTTATADEFDVLSRDLIESFAALLPKLIKRGADIGIQLGEQMEEQLGDMASAMGLLTNDAIGLVPFDTIGAGVDAFADKLNELFQAVSDPLTQKNKAFLKPPLDNWHSFIQEINLIFHNLDWLIFPIARYFVQNHIPGGITYRPDGDSDSSLDSQAAEPRLEAAVSDSIRQLVHIKSLDREHQERALLAIEEACYLSKQVFGQIEQRMDQQDLPMPYSLFLSTLVESYERFVDGLKDSLRDAQKDPSLKSLFDNQTFLKYVPRGDMQGPRSQTIFIPITYASEEIIEKCQSSNQTATIRLPYCVDLSYWFAANSRNQGRINACTAFVVKEIVEFLLGKMKPDKVAFEASALFLYRAALESEEEEEAAASLLSSLQNFTKLEDTPSTSIRTIIKTLVRLGVPPEKSCPYPGADDDDAISKVKASPFPNCYFSAQKIRITKYFKLDQKLASHRDLLLIQIKAIVASCVPCMFAIKAMSALEAVDEDAFIPYSDDSEAAGHALIVAGYDDTVKIGNWQGALLVRNSWGDAWGRGGYAWLPYEYVLDSTHRVVDCWALLEWQWMKQGNFGLALEGWVGGPPRQDGDP